MKKISLLIIGMFITILSMADELILIDNLGTAQVKQLFKSEDLTIHHYTDDMVIATATGEYEGEHSVLIEDPWGREFEYFLVRFAEVSRENYLEELSSVSEILYENHEMAFISVNPEYSSLLYPSVHGGLIRITGNEARLPETKRIAGRVPQGIRSDINAMMAEVDTINLESYIQHMQDYGTRNAYSSQAVQAQNWIFDQFMSFGLDVELHDFFMPGGEASDNVIATLLGTTYPDEYVICGAHYDSYSFSGGAPGADDNASGTAGILEVARIMSQYSFDRSIIFAAWGGEEYGLYGSEAWASEAANEGMNILGYFNMDMAGYLNPGDEIHTDIIAPASAQELVDFYIDVCSTYLPDFGVYQGFLSGGDSDHTSFNNNGYLGIFPFEDDDYHSPYIHTSNDVIGPSVNSFEMHGIFTQAMIANVATMADQLPSPENLSATAGDGYVDLIWQSLEDVDYYNIYRNDDITPYATATDTVYLDEDVENMTPYTYSITAVFLSSGEESPHSNEVTVVPMPPILLPFTDDFETGGYYWTKEDTWGLKEGVFFSPSNSMTESPDGNYDNDMNASATLRSVDLSMAYTAEMSFWTKYLIEENYDYMYLEVSTDGNTWEMIDSFTGAQASWEQQVYSLNDYIGEETFYVRFRFFSDVYVRENGMHIDDFSITIDGVSVTEINTGQSGEFLQNNPNPFTSSTEVVFRIAERSTVKMEIHDAAGKLIAEPLNAILDSGLHRVTVGDDISHPGIYYITLSTDHGNTTRKIVKTN